MLQKSTAWGGFFFCVFWRLSTALLTKYSLSYIVSLQCPSGNCPENYWQDTAFQGKKSASRSEPQDGSQYWSLRHNIPGVRSVYNLDLYRGWGEGDLSLWQKTTQTLWAKLEHISTTSSGHWIQLWWDGTGHFGVGECWYTGGELNFVMVASWVIPSKFRIQETLNLSTCAN